MTDKDGQVIQYTDGYAWGVAPDGRTICLGTEPEIRVILANPKQHPNNPTIAQVIGLERKLSKKIQEEEQVSLERASVIKQERHEKAIELGVARKAKSRQNKRGVKV